VARGLLRVCWVLHRHRHGQRRGPRPPYLAPHRRMADDIGWGLAARRHVRGEFAWWGRTKTARNPAIGQQAFRGQIDTTKESRSSANGSKGGWWAQQVWRVGRHGVGDKKFVFLAETLPKLRFLWSFHLFGHHATWRVGPAWGVRRARIWWEKFSIVFAPYSIDRYVAGLLCFNR
jgi:hypothetical protein